MQMKIIPIRRALISVSNKTGIVEFAKNLSELGVEIVSTGGTSQLLAQAKIPHKQVEDITGLPEMLGGRVKTLHPKIHGGILGKRDKHELEALENEIQWIDLVVVNFYPFTQSVKKEMTWDEIVEYIDIGGPTMVRAAAKNFAWVGVVIDPLDYGQILAALNNQGGLDLEFRKQLAQKAFALTYQYDAAIHRYFVDRAEKNPACPPLLHLHLEKLTELRYGENPHQKACAYQFVTEKTGVLAATQFQGKPLSYNNILDAEAASSCVREFSEPTAVIVKHANPCGVATATTIEKAYERAFAADSVSAFGGIIALNRPCTKAIAEAINSVFMEIVLAPAFTDEALTILAAKPNLRVLELPTEEKEEWEMKFITGGMLLQEKDKETLHIDDLKFVTKLKPKQEDIHGMLFAWRVLKHVKSNGILIAKNDATVGIGAGQVSRIDAVDIAIQKAGEHLQDAILASDAFFPFRDSIDRIANRGIRAIIQPGGSVRDEEVIAACDEAGIAMAFTGKRCFRH